MPNIPASIIRLQQDNSSRDTFDAVQASGPSMDFQGGNNNVTTTFVKKTKDETVYEEVLPEVQRELVVKYDNNITAVSNYSYVHKRDNAGNITFEENATDNQLLIIEPITYKFNTSFINKTINTRFSYFQFPATSIASIDSPEFEKLNQALDVTFRELRTVNVDNFVAAGESFISDVGNTVSSATNAVDVITNAIDNATFNDVALTQRQIEQSAGYNRPN